ncbi:MAG: HEAT repeat domain-containing protein [Gemmatimonadales bacterium]
MLLRAFALTTLLAAASSPLVAQQNISDPSATRPLSAWIADLQASSPETRHDAAYNMAWMGPAAAPAVPALVTALERPDEVAVVLYAIEVALREIGPPANAALPALDQMLDDPNDDVAFMAKKAIKAIKTPAPADSTSH